MKRFFHLIAFLTALVGCQSVDSNVTDSVAENHGCESFKQIEFSIKDTTATRSPTPITDLSQFNVTATTGSAGSEESKLVNVVFENKSGVFRSDAVWPSSDPGYHFYASNVEMTHTASGQTVVISTIDKDVVCAYLASPSYKMKNDLVFSHILARVGTVTFTNLDFCSNVKLSMKYSGSGKYNIGTGKWSGLGSQSTKELTTDNNDFWIIPGTYQATLTYNDANGTAHSKTLDQEFLAGKVNNISAKLDGSVVVKTEDEYETPTFNLGAISDIPAGGGDSDAPSVTAVGQRKRIKKTLADGTVKYDPDWTAVSNPDYTIQYGKTLSSLSDNCPSYHGDNLGTNAKARTKLGDIYVRVKIGGKTTDKSLAVYQAANVRHKGQTAEKNHTKTGSITYGERNYYGDITYGEKKYGSEYLKDTSYGSEVQDADTYGSWTTYSTTVDKYDYAVSFATTSWSPGAVATNKANAITASHYERDKCDQRRTVTHHYHTPYTQHYYKDWTRTNSRSYTCSASQNCNYVEYRTDTFDSGATEYVEEKKSHKETWTASGTDNNYSEDSGSDWSKDVKGSTSRTSDGGYGYQTTYGSGTKKTDSPSPSSSQNWLTYTGGSMYVSSNSSTSSRKATLSVSNGTASASCSVTQAAATITYTLTCTGTAVSLDAGQTKEYDPTVKYIKYVNGNYNSESDVTKNASFSTGSTSIATVSTSGSFLKTYKVTGVAAGTTKIYATYNNISSRDNGDSGISVTVKKVYSISVNPTSLTFDCTASGSGSQKSVAVICPEGDWEVSSTTSGWTATKSGNTLYVYPNAVNASTTSDKTGTVTVRCKGDNSKTAEVNVAQGKNTEEYDIEIE